MNQDLLALTDASRAALFDLLGAPALLLPHGDGEPIDMGDIGISELPDGIVQARYGQDYERVIEAALRRVRLVAHLVDKDDVLEVTAGQQLGSWRVLGIERQDDAIVTVRARVTTPRGATAPGAKVVRR